MHPRREPAGPILSVCIPAYGVQSKTLQATVDSALGQLPDGAELILLPNGAEAIAVVSELDLPPAVAVVPSEQELGLVTNWNRCFTHSTGELVHILHADDLVAPGFYEAILTLVDRYPEAAMYATTAADFDETVVVGRGLGSGGVTLLEGGRAAAFLLDDPRHSCGNVVLSSAVVERRGPFRKEFPYCPDEEAFLRYAADGPLALDPRPLYLQRRHEGQVRFSTWRRPDFISVYVASRISGAENFGDEVVQLARDSTLKRCVSVAMTLALAGEAGEAKRVLDEVGRCLPHARSSLRLRTARLATTKPLRPAVVARRRTLDFFRRGSGAGRAAIEPPDTQEFSRTT